MEYPRVIYAILGYSAFASCRVTRTAESCSSPISQSGNYSISEANILMLLRGGDAADIFFRQWGTTRRIERDSDDLSGQPLL